MSLVPKHCVWEVTLRCNLKCLHCGSRAGGPRGSELDAEEALRLIHDLKVLGCQRVILSGGEPLLREDLPEIVRRIKDEGMKPCLVSNGFILPPRDLPLHSAATSLDGLEETHNRLRGHEKSFERAVESVRLLTGLFVDVYVITQVNRLNHADLEGLYDLIAGLDVDGWQLQLTSEMGRAEELGLTKAQVRHLLDFIVDKKGGPLRIHPGDDLGYYYRGEFGFKGCQGGLSVIGIEADGGVKPCLSMQKGEGFLGGNIRQRSLKEIWEDPGFAVFNRKGRELSGRCAECGHRGVCRGGCVGTAMAYGSLDEYPFC